MAARSLAGSVLAVPPSNEHLVDLVGVNVNHFKVAALFMENEAAATDTRLSRDNRFFKSSATRSVMLFISLGCSILSAFLPECSVSEKQAGAAQRRAIGRISWAIP